MKDIVNLISQKNLLLVLICLTFYSICVLINVVLQLAALRFSCLFSCFLNFFLPLPILTFFFSPIYFCFQRLKAPSVLFFILFSFLFATSKLYSVHQDSLINSLLVRLQLGVILKMCDLADMCAIQFLFSSYLVHKLLPESPFSGTCLLSSVGTTRNSWTKQSWWKICSPLLANLPT